MVRRILALTAIFLLLVSVAFLILPLPSSIFSKREEFPREAPVALTRAAQIKGGKCREDTVYTTDKFKGDHEGQGYEYTVDDRCVQLQKQLIEAIDTENLYEIETLISQGANVSVSDLTPNMPVSPALAAAGKNYQVAKLILDNGADVNFEQICCMSRDTPLGDAVKAGNKETVKLLLERGAEVDFKSYALDGNHSIFGLARHKGDEEIKSILAQACDKDISCRLEYRKRKVSNLFLKLCSANSISTVNCSEDF